MLRDPFAAAGLRAREPKCGALAGRPLKIGIQFVPQPLLFVSRAFSRKKIAPSGASEKVGAGLKNCFPKPAPTKKRQNISSAAQSSEAEREVNELTLPTTIYQPFIKQPRSKYTELSTADLHRFILRYTWLIQRYEKIRQFKHWFLLFHTSYHNAPNDHFYRIYL